MPLPHTESQSFTGEQCQVIFLRQATMAVSVQFGSVQSLSHVQLCDPMD